MKRYKTLGENNGSHAACQFFMRVGLENHLIFAEILPDEKFPFSSGKECIDELRTVEEWIAWMLEEVKNETDI